MSLESHMKSVGPYRISSRTWMANYPNETGRLETETGYRIIVENDGIVCLDYYVSPRFGDNNSKEVFRRINANIHSHRRGVDLPRYLKPKMGNLEFQDTLGLA